MQPIPAIHHITAITGDPLANADFYQRVLGQRLVKATVNYDDPGTYHLYYGDAVGTPGTILTFFAWPGAGRPVPGSGEATAVAYAIRPESTAFWLERLADYGVETGRPAASFGDEVITLRDPDGMPIDLVASRRRGPTRHWEDSPVPPEHALRGLFGVALRVAALEPTAQLLTDQLGFRVIGREEARWRFGATGPGPGLNVDLIVDPTRPPGRLGAGSIHHVAFRAPDEAAQAGFQRSLAQAGLSVTPVRDRGYFSSIYFREPGGVLFELATDEPGFAVDEPASELGRRLQLPPWLEPHRPSIESALPPLPRLVGEGALEMAEPSSHR